MFRSVVTLTILAGAACAAQRFDLQVRDDFFAGFGGDRARLEAGMKKCEQALAVSPNYAEALVWHGAGLFYQAGASFRGGDAAGGVELSTRGQREMDRAVELEPGNLGVRIPRGAALLTASRAMPPSPAAAAVLKKGLADYETAFDLQREYFATLSGHARGELLFGLAEGYLRAGEPGRARAWFEKLAAIEDADHAGQARQYLAGGKLEGSAGCVGCHAGKQP